MYFMGGTSDFRRLDYIDPSSKLEATIIKEPFLALFDVVGNKDRYNIGGPEYITDLQLNIEVILDNMTGSYVRLERDKYLVGIKAGSREEAELKTKSLKDLIEGKKININDDLAKKSKDIDLRVISLRFSLAENNGNLKVAYLTLNKEIEKQKVTKI